MLRAAAATVRGPAHIATGCANQDSLSLRGWRGGWIAAVSDGLGSRPFSATGSRLAVRAAQHTLRTMVPADQLLQASPRQLATETYRCWLRTVPHANKADAACTILIVACDQAGNAVIWQMGDGMVLCRSLGELRVITPERPAFGNETRALGIHRAWSDWNTAQVNLRAPGDAVALMTDGVSDDVDPARHEGFVKAVVNHLGKRSRRAGRDWLKNELTRWATPNHADDKTIAVIYRT